MNESRRLLNPSWLTRMDWLCGPKSYGYVLDDNDRCAIREGRREIDLLGKTIDSLEADNRRLRAACEPVARALANWRTLHRLYPPDYERIELTHAEADAVMAGLAPAAAGGEGP